MQINTKNPFPMEYTIGGKQTKYNGKSKNNEVENYKFFFLPPLPILINQIPNPGEELNYFLPTIIYITRF